MNTPATHRLALRLLFWEGALAMMYETWTGPTYLAGLAGELRVPVTWVSLFCAAAWIGAAGQLVGISIYGRASSQKRLTLSLATAARALWLVPLGFAFVLFPGHPWFALMTAVACASALLGSASSASWSAWVRALVPEEARGRFFGLRQRYIMSALILANWVAALCVDWKPHGTYAGFLILGILALTAAALSTYLLGRVPEPELAASGARLDWRQCWRSRPFRGVVIYGAAFTFAMQLASPYFSYYFTRELGFGMSRVAAWTLLTNAGAWIASARWGAWLDGKGRDPRRAMRLLGSCVALSPLYYLAGHAGWIAWIAPLDYFGNGILWTGYWLSLTMLLYQVVPAGQSAIAGFSVFMAVSGLSGALGSFAGGKLADQLMRSGQGFGTLWVLATAARLAALWAFYPLLARATVREPRLEAAMETDT